MSATEELRRQLDERGVEWTSPSGLNSSFADSITFIGDIAVISEIDGSDLLRINFDGTPEQAIDATLGRGECDRLRAENDKLRELVRDMCVWAYIDSYCDLEDEFADTMRELGVEA